MPALGSSNKPEKVERQQRRKRKTPPPPTPRTGAFGGLAPATAPLTRAQGVARQRVKRAKRKLPPRPLPHVPIIKHPTPQQTRAAHDIITHARNRAVGSGGSAAQRAARRAEIDDEFLADPKMARAIRHYGHAAERQAALGVAKAFGLRGSRQQRLAAGRGLLARRRANDRVKAGPPPIEMGLAGIGIPGASINLSAIGTQLGKFGQQIASGHGGFLQNPSGIVRNAGSDIANFPVNAVRGIYEGGAAAVDLAKKAVERTPQGRSLGVHGSTDRAEALLSAMRHGALGELVTGHPSKALRAFEEHPFYSALDVTAAGGVLGRTAGAGMRAGLLGKAAQARAGLARDPLVLVPGTNQVRARGYSRNQIVKEVQLAAERAARRQGLDPNVARESIIPFRGRTHALNQEVDEFAAQAEGMRRRGREEVAAEAKDVRPSRFGHDRDVVAAAAEGRLVVEKDGRLVEPSTPAEFRRALERERDRLQDVYRAERKSMSPRARRGNREQVKALDKAIGDPKTLRRFKEVFAAADEYKGVADRLERDLIARKALDPEQATAAKLRAYAVAVMGARHDKTLRAPDAMAARHESARTAEASARESLDSARSKVRRLAARRDRLVGAQASRRGRRQHEGAGGAATKAERGKLERATAELKAARTEARAADAKWRQARRDRVKSNPKKYATGLVDKDGHRITTAQIEEHIRANAGRTPAFLSHRTDTAGARSFFVNWFGGRKTTDAKGTRTGESTRQGSHAANFKALEEHVVRQQGVVDAIDTFDEFVARMGMSRPDGRPFTWDQAVKAAEDVEEATGVPMVPVRAVPARYDAASREAILHAQKSGSMPDWFDSLTERRMADALAEPTGKARQAPNTVLVPASQLERFRKHQTSGTSVGGKLGHAITRAFRGTVLPFSTKWLTGNVAEAELRMLMYGVRPIHDARMGRAIFREMRKLDEKAWRQADTRLRGGLLYGSGDRLNVHSAAEDFEGSVLETPAKVLAQTARLPVIKQTLGGLRAYQRAVFALNRGFERYAQSAAIGKLARGELQEFGKSWGRTLRIQEDAVRQVASGMLDTATQVRMARQLDEMLGKYGRYSPTTRRAIQTFAPFLPWYLNAAKFVYYTLPVKHPVKAALLATAERAFADEIQAQRESVPPGSLESGIPLKDGGILDVARYTPFGAFTNMPEGFVDPLLPQLSSAVLIMQGRSFTGRDLQTQSGEPPSRGMFGKRTFMALYSALESAVPGIAIGRRLQEHGESPFDDSTIFAPKTKPGTGYGGSAVNRILNPVRPTYLGAPSASVSSGRRGPPTQEDRIDAALRRLDAFDALDAAEDERINRALQSLAP